MCKQPSETRRAEWNKWLKFNADISLTDEEVRQLTEAGCEINPMKWVDTDKKRISTKRYSLSLCSRKVQESTGWLWKLRGNRRGLRTDSPAGDVDSHNIVCSWCAQAHFSTHSCDFTNGYFQGQEIDRILLCRTPAEGIPEEGFAGGEFLASRGPVHGTQDAGRGLWLRLKKRCKKIQIPIEPNSADFVSHFEMMSQESLL